MDYQNKTSHSFVLKVTYLLQTKQMLRVAALQ